jgi:hypothetical protein
MRTENRLSPLLLIPLAIARVYTSSAGEVQFFLQEMRVGENS